MKTVGIIAEYNPFHLGHVHQLEEIRKQYRDACIIVVMSGDFTQRGMPAIFSKFHRAKWALQNGAHLVLELPTFITLSSAEYFARGGVTLLGKLGVDHISFGSESDDLPLLIEIAQSFHTPSVQEGLKNNINRGMTYGSALRKAMSDAIPHSKEVMAEPNSILAVEYLRTIYEHNLSMEPLLIHRQSQHHSTTLTHQLPSGSALRRAIQDWEETGQAPIWEDYVPPSVIEEFQSLIHSFSYSSMEQWHESLHFMLQRTHIEELASLYTMSDGLESLWIKHRSAPKWSDFLERVKSKRYTFTRLQRLGAYLALRMTKEIMASFQSTGPLYTRLLGITDYGRQWLSQANVTIPIVNKWAPFCQTKDPMIQSMVTIDNLAHRLWSHTLKNREQRDSHSTFRQSPIYLP